MMKYVGCAERKGVEGGLSFGRDGGGGVRAALPGGFCPLYSSGFKRMTYPLCF